MNNKNRKKSGVTANQIHRALSGIPFPALRRDVIEYARNSGSSNGVMDLLSKLENHEFRNESQIINELGLNNINNKEKKYENPTQFTSIQG